MPTEDWNAYAEYNKILRAWFVAFGIGVPATFLIHEELVVYVSAPKGDPYIFVVFLIGAAAQVLMAFLNKTINWCAYYKTKKFSKRKPSNGWEKISAFFAKASDWFLIDVIFDLVTLGCFSYAIIKLFYQVLG